MEIGGGEADGTRALEAGVGRELERRPPVDELDLEPVARPEGRMLANPLLGCLVSRYGEAARLDERSGSPVSASNPTSFSTLRLAMRPNATSERTCTASPAARALVPVPKGRRSTSATR